MANGIFGNGGSRGAYTHRSYGYSSSYGRGGGVSPGVAAVILAVLVVLFVLQYRSQRAEVELDRTAYHQQARANFQAWEEGAGLQVRPGSLWIEDGSSRIGGGDFHCKGGSYFDLDEGRVVHFCCSVQPKGAGINAGACLRCIDGVAGCIGG